MAKGTKFTEEEEKIIEAAVNEEKKKIRMEMVQNEINQRIYDLRYNQPSYS